MRIGSTNKLFEINKVEPLVLIYKRVSKYKKTAIAIMLIACAVAGAMEMLPGDGARVTGYGIEAKIAERPMGLN